MAHINQITDLQRLKDKLSEMKIKYDILPGVYTDNFAKKLFLIDEVGIEFLFNEKTDKLIKPVRP